MITSGHITSHARKSKKVDLEDQTAKLHTNLGVKCILQAINSNFLVTHDTCSAHVSEHSNLKTNLSEDLGSNIFDAACQRLLTQQHLPYSLLKTVVTQQHLPSILPKTVVTQQHFPYSFPKTVVTQQHLLSSLPKTVVTQQHLLSSLPKTVVTQQYLGNNCTIGD